MKTIIFKDSFANTPDDMYAPGFICEQNCEKPHMLGAVIDHRFCIMYKGNKHIPLTGNLKDFTLKFLVSSESFYDTMGLEIYFHYDLESHEGWCLRYDWGICGAKTHREQKQTQEYTVGLFRYYGSRRFDKYEAVAQSTVNGFITDFTREQPIELKLEGNQLTFSHDLQRIAHFNLPSDGPKNGLIAFDKSHIPLPGKNGVHRISGVSVESNIETNGKVVRPETETEFPAGINGIISPYFFHVEVIKRNGIDVLRSGLSGGPSPEYVRDVNRYRFNEKMSNPYIRLEDAGGNTFGTYYLADGSVGLNSYDWNVDCSVMLPADFECPLSHNFELGKLPDGAKIFIGYGHYIAEDSICNAGGPGEALIDQDGRVLWSGPRFAVGDVVFNLVSSSDKQICNRIPADIPRYEDALAFARNNHFFIEGEDVKFKVTVDSRDQGIDEIRASITIEDVFGAKLGFLEIPFIKSENLSSIGDAKRYSTEFFTLDKLAVGVYHIRVKIIGAALPEERYAFEVMPENPESLCAPLASGLPKLWPNILSGVCNEHFHPWSRAVSNTIHYNSGGNNYFKVARKWRAPELLHVYGRQWLCYLGFLRLQERDGIEENCDLIEQSDCAGGFLCRRRDLWGPVYYGNEFVFESLLKFLQGDNFVKVKNGILTYEKLSKSAPRALSREEFKELFTYNWKNWLVFFSRLNMESKKAESRKLTEISGHVQPFHFCPVYPTYGSNYKSAYFPLLFGIDPRDDYAGYYPGANGFEDYPYSSGYPIAKGIYNLASCKLEVPDLPLHPEVFAINGETLDARVVFANPPLGQSDPPYGFLIKQFYEYSFATVWFDDKGFNYWKDQGYHVKTFDRENYQELLYAYSFISKVTPQKPLRTSAFVFSRDACMAHPDYYDCDEDFFAEGSVVNTAEEAVAFAYEEARRDGQQAGFVMRLEDIELLNPEDVDTLVLPPLTGISDKEKNAIRKLHEKGISLLGFEDVSGLEDIFGVDAAEKVQVHEIVPESGDGLFAELEGMSEHAEHELCVVRHRLDGAKLILKAENDVPVLTLHETGHGRAAFFTLPPTFVKRSKTLVPSYGQRNNSALIAKATRLAMRYLGDKQVATSAGTLIAFRDTENKVHIIVAEDANPEKSVPIRPLVEIKILGLKIENINSDKEFEIVSAESGKIRLRFNLGIAESARMTCCMTE